MSENVEPRLVRGCQDLMPEQMLARQWMIDVIRGVYELYGFVPLDTPAIEYLDALQGTGGDEAEASIFSVVNPDHRDREFRLGLRFDLTVPLARVVAQYPDLPKPFRRYQVASVWRTDKPGAGRYRQFTQFDLDSVGVDSVEADTEIIAGMADTLSALNVGPFRVRFSSRAVLNLLLPFAGIDQGRAADVFRVLDKLEKIGPGKVRLELTSGYKDESGDTIPGLGLSAAQVDKIETFLRIRSDRRGAVLDELRGTFDGVPEAPKEIDVLARISRHLDALGYDEDRVVIDLSTARGLAYYTGPVFEAVLLDAPQFGSVFAGGRYDDLVTRFLGQRIPATGASIGVDRLLAALIKLGRVEPRRATAKVLVTTLDRGLMDDYLKITYELRRAGVPAELYLGMEKRIGKQFKYASNSGKTVAIVVGEDELKAEQVSIKDLRRGEELSKEVGDDRKRWLEEQPAQFSVPRSELVAAVNKVLDRYAGGC